MSTLKVDNIRHNNATSDAITMASDGTCTAKVTDVGGGQLSHRNILNNGAMTISQRGTTFSHDSSNNNFYNLDRWRSRDSGLNFDCTITQSTDSPPGFANSLKITPDVTETPTGSNNGFITQQPPGIDAQRFAHGTSSAKSMTLSFYAKTGSQNNGHQYSLQIRKYDSSGNRKVVIQPFTVTSSWQRFTMTFPGDTATAINNTDDYQGMEINWHLCTGPDDLTSAQPTWGTPLSSYWAGVTGQSNFMDNTNNEFYLTGCQLEVGDTATSFEHLSRNEELERCKRYYQTLPSGLISVRMAQNVAYSNAGMQSTFILPTPMRASPSLLNYSDGTSQITHTFYDDNYSNATSYELNMFSSIHNGTVRFSFNYSQAHNGGSSLGTNFKFGISQDPIAFTAEF